MLEVHWGMFEASIGVLEVWSIGMLEMYKDTFRDCNC